MVKKGGFGGGCHWCTEAVFASLNGVLNVEQGWVASIGENTSLSEGVIVEFDDDKISFSTLIEVHLYTHSATSLHTMRGKYRSAIYTFSTTDTQIAEAALQELQRDFKDTIITAVMPFGTFVINREESLDYYFSDPYKPFCKTYINPKLRIILKQFSGAANKDKLRHLEPKTK